MYGLKMMCDILISFYLRLFLTKVFLNHSGFLDHTQLTHTVGLLWTSDQPVASTYTGQHKRQNIHALSGIRIRDPSNRAAADLCLRPRGHRGRLYIDIPLHNFNVETWIIFISTHFCEIFIVIYVYKCTPQIKAKFPKLK
jgi:hypothetical protein